MSDLVTRIWAGPFEAHDAHGRLVQVGQPIEVTPRQANENPVWFEEPPAPAAPRARPIVPEPVEIEV